MEITSVESFLDYYSKIIKRTLRVIDDIPENKMDWRPKEGSFSFGDIIRHLSNLERYMFVESIQGKPNRYPGHVKGIYNGDGYPVKYLRDQYKNIFQIISTLSDEDLNEKCITPDNATISVWKWLRAMVEHHIHHRGQLYTYLKLIEKSSKPLYGLTSEEVKQRGEG